MLLKLTNTGSGVMEMPNGVALGIGQSTYMLISDELLYMINHGFPPPQDKASAAEMQMLKDVMALAETGALLAELSNVEQYAQPQAPVQIVAGGSVGVIMLLTGWIATVAFQVNAQATTDATLTITSGGQTLATIKISKDAVHGAVISTTLNVLEGNTINIGDNYQVNLDEGGKPTSAGNVLISVMAAM